MGRGRERAVEWADSGVGAAGGVGGGRRWRAAEEDGGGVTGIAREPTMTIAPGGPPAGRRAGRARRSVGGGGGGSGARNPPRGELRLTPRGAGDGQRWRGRSGRHCCGSWTLDGAKTGPRPHRHDRQPGAGRRHRRSTRVGAGGPVGAGPTIDADGMTGDGDPRPAAVTLRGGRGGGVGGGVGGSGSTSPPAATKDPAGVFSGAITSNQDERRRVPLESESARAHHSGGGRAGTPPGAPSAPARSATMGTKGWREPSPRVSGSLRSSRPCPRNHVRTQRGGDDPLSSLSGSEVGGGGMLGNGTGPAPPSDRHPRLRTGASEEATGRCWSQAPRTLLPPTRPVRTLARLQKQVRAGGAPSQLGTRNPGPRTMTETSPARRR